MLVICSFNHITVVFLFIYFFTEVINCGFVFKAHKRQTYQEIINK